MEDRACKHGYHHCHRCEAEALERAHAVAKHYAAHEPVVASGQAGTATEVCIWDHRPKGPAQHGDILIWDNGNCTYVPVYLPADFSKHVKLNPA